MTSKSKFFRADGFEVEFITVLSRNNNAIRKIEFLDINAECLANLTLFLSETIKFEFEPNLFVTIPTPEAFIIHKLLISENRDPNKRIKDSESIQRIYDAIQNNDNSRFHLNELYQRLSKKEKNRILKTIQNLNLQINLE